MPRMLTLVLLILVAATGCDSAPAPEAPSTDAPPPVITPAPTTTEKELDAEDPNLIKRPFTAEQIRDEWIAGLTILMRTQSMENVTLERWKVLASDEEAAEIEFTPVDAEGNPAGEVRTARSTWIDLRNHASFPANATTREDVTMDTALGSLDGWLYKVHNIQAGTVTEFFFAKSLPGAPALMRVLREGTAVMELSQIERQRPE